MTNVAATAQSFSSAEGRLILSLVNRLGEKLPNSASSNNELDDPIITQSVLSLVNLSEQRLSMVSSGLATLLENISKPSTSSSSETNPVLERSQLFVLQSLGKCMDRHWEFFRKAVDLPKPMPGETSSQDTMIRPLSDPPALEEALVKQIFALCVRFLQVEASDVANDMHKAAGQVLFYISASNFPIFFARIKARIQALSVMTEENADLFDVQLLEHINLNSRRLSEILQELSSSCRSFKRTVLVNLAVILRRAIWNWITAHPMEFVSLCQSQRRLAGGPDVLFDIFDAMADNYKKKLVFWPVQTMLLTLCPDILINITVREGSSAAVTSGKSTFLSNLKKSLKTKNLADVAAISYVDICRAATYVSKNDKLSALRHLVPEIENELKDRLFDPQNPFTNQDGIVDQQIMIDCLTASFRLNSRNVIWSLFPICLQDDAPSIFKLVLVKSCLQIATEENRLPWNPTISATYSNLASPLRKLFLDFLTAKRTVDPKSKVSSFSLLSSAKKKEAANSEEEARTELDIQLNILSLYIADPTLALFSADPKTQREENRGLIIGLTLCVQDANLRAKAAKALSTLHQPSMIAQWASPEEIMPAFWEISCQVTLSLAKQIIEREDEATVRFLLTLLADIFKARNDFLLAHSDVAAVGASIQEHNKSSTMLEIALLVLLCSQDNSIWTTAARCLGALCTEAELLAEIDYVHPIADNLEHYKELASTSSVVSGRQVQQKRIRRLLRHIDRPSAGNMAAWEEAYRRWAPQITVIAKVTSESALAESKETRSGGTLFQKSDKKDKIRDLGLPALDDKGEWQNYTGFLCALGGVCIALQDAASKGHSPGTTSSDPPPTLSKASVSLQSFTDASGGNRAQAQQAMFKFVEELLDWLVCDSVAVRESVKDTIGMEISSALYPMLFSCMRSRVDTFFDTKNEEVIASERATLLIEQLIVIVRLILERVTSFSDTLASVDLESLLLQFSRYLNRLGRTSTSLRIKIKMTTMVEVLMTKRSFISFRQEIKFRNKLLENFVEWTSDFAVKSEGSAIQAADEAGQIQKYSKDLDLACMKTIHALLYQLPLQPMDSSLESDSSSLSEARALLFNKYFSFMTKLLNRCRMIDSFERGTHSGKITKDLQDLLNRSKDVLKDLVPLRDYTILAMSNMLNANVDSGLKYSLSMGYHEDSKTRTAFMQVLTNILNQGTEFAELDEVSLQDRYTRLVDLFVQPDHYLATALCDAVNVNDGDELAPLLISIFESRNSIGEFLKDMIEREVLRTLESPSLFRRNSLTTKLITAYLKTAGFEFLTTTLKPAFTALRDLQLGEHGSFEVDPTRIKPNENADANMQLLITMTKLFLDCIVNSYANMPLALRQICYHTRLIVEKRFPEANLTAVGGLVFLRFFCPAIVAPDSLGLVKDMSPRDPRRRGLLLITKSIQNLANRIDQWSKEAFMGPLNETLRTYVPSIDRFLQDISAEVDTATPAPQPGAAVAALEENDLFRLHFYVNENLEKIGKELASRRLPASIESVGDLEGDIKKVMDTLTHLLVQLGPVSDQAAQGKNVGQTKLMAPNQLYLEFMQRNAKRNVEPIKSRRIFFEGTLSKERRPVFYYISRKFVNGQVDEELLIYFVLQNLKPAMGKPFDVVIDLTQFSTDNEVPNQWLTQLLQIVPPEVTESVANIYFYNANSVFKKYTKRLSRFISAKTQKKMIFISTLSEFSEYINVAELQLPKSTLAIETDLTENGSTYQPVLKVSQFYAHAPVVVKVGSETIHVASVKKHEFFNTSATIIDIYHVSEIDEILSSTKGTESEITIKFERGTSSQTFSTPKAADIARALNTAKARFQLSKPSNVSARMIRPKDVPGTLLNMGLLNMGSDEPGLRQAAYNLLYSLSIAFTFDAGNQLLEAKGLCIPANNTSFVISIANKLSVSEPHLTLEFLSEGLIGFKKSNMELKHLALEYMAPWLTNLTLFCLPSTAPDSAEKIKRTEEIIRQLIEITIEEAEMYPSLQSKVWYTIANVDEAVDLVLESFIKCALQHQLGSRQAEVMADTAVTLASGNVRVAGKIISRLRRAIAQSAVQPLASLNQHAKWQEICVLLRFALMLSFNNRLNVQQYLPELFYVISMVVATGPLLIRASVHGIVVNLVQSLCTSMQLSDESIRSLTVMISQFSEPKYKLLFGISRGGIATNAFSTQDANEDINEKLPLSSLETIISSLLDVIGFAATPETASTWIARWMSLVTTTAFKHNPALQPRAFVALGSLARLNRVNDELLLFQILISLVDALNAFQEDDNELIVAIIMCLQRITPNMPNDSRFLRSLFWVAVGLVQINHVELFIAGVDFLEVVIRTLDARGFFNDTAMTAFLMQARVPLEGISKQLDSLVGVNFTTNFSFGMAVTLLRGLKHPSTKAATVRLLSTFLEISGSKKSSSSNTVFVQLLGFLAPLMPIIEEHELKTLMWTSGLQDIVDSGSAGSKLEGLFNRLVKAEPTSTSLLGCLFATMLQNAEYETESLFIYNFFAEASLQTPDMFMLVYDSLVGKMAQATGSSQNVKVVEAVQSILYTVVSMPSSKPRKTQTQYLSELGFAGLIDCGTFALVPKPKKKQCATLVAQLTHATLK